MAFQSRTVTLCASRQDIIEPSTDGFRICGRQLHIDGAESGMAVYSIIQQLMCMVFVVKGGAISDSLGRRPVLAVSLLILAVCIAPTGYITSFSAIVSLSAVFGLANGMQSGAQNALIADMVRHLCLFGKRLCDFVR